MSHSKLIKRGRSLYIDRWNPAAKKYIHSCCVCGQKGYRTEIENDSFCCTREKQAIFNVLVKTMSRLSLDEWGRYADCAGVQDTNG